jgi:hypothetical protein
VKKKILFSFITLCIFLLLIELVFRIIFYFNYNKYDTSLSIQGNSLQMADDTLVFRNRPCYLDKKKSYQFNSEGFKSAAGEVQMPEKGPGDFWVFLFGASAMEGMGSNKDGEWLDITGVRDYSYAESPVFQLQQHLQLKMPNRKVRVFCAANSGFSVYQSMLQYQRLKKKYKIDWVISLDGVNEPLMGQPGTSLRSYIESSWKDYPIFKSPVKYIIPVTRRSAFINAIKQSLFEAKMDKRLDKAKDKNYPARIKWLSANAGQLIYDTASPVIAASVDTFFYYMNAFDRELIQDKVPHLLFVQPHLAMRDTIKSSGTEKALFNYFKSTSHNNAAANGYIKQIHARALELDTAGSIQSLSFMHSNTFETFVDYCHFSDEAIKQLSIFFADRIVSQHNSKVGP